MLFRSLKIKVVDASGAALAGQTVKVSGAGVLQTNADGMAQFLTENAAALDIEINGASVWAGNSGDLARDEVFRADGAGFARVGAG